VPDNIAPMLGPGDVNATFDRYGVRVPAVVVSPFAKRHFVSHRVHDHTSILRFIERRFGLPALTQRDAHANPMLEFFDFEHPSFRARPYCRLRRWTLLEPPTVRPWAPAAEACEQGPRRACPLT
jgi:phospholipase C